MKIKCTMLVIINRKYSCVPVAEILTKEVKDLIGVEIQSFTFNIDISHAYDHM